MNARSGFRTRSSFSFVPLYLRCGELGSMSLSICSAIVATSLGVEKMQNCLSDLRFGVEWDSVIQELSSDSICFFSFFCFSCFWPVPFLSAANEKLGIRMEKALFYYYCTEKTIVEGSTGELARRSFTLLLDSRDCLSFTSLNRRGRE